MVAEPLGVVRVARGVLSTIVINAALQIPGVVRLAHRSDQWFRLLGREIEVHRPLLSGHWGAWVPSGTGARLQNGGVSGNCTTGRRCRILPAGETISV